ncbi:MAG TPA: hypothetical protein VLG50_00005 [Candidatus Saccharimonadales bacterium]|nr:hypothetical protein [Candidatus Saccharimonadales bacterium]
MKNQLLLTLLLSIAGISQSINAMDQNQPAQCPSVKIIAVASCLGCYIGCCADSIIPMTQEILHDFMYGVCIAPGPYDGKGNNKAVAESKKML